MTSPSVATPLRPASVSGQVVRSPVPGADGKERLLTIAAGTPGRADLVLEGGGVKGLGLVGAVLALDSAGYEFNRVAGASAGAIVATLVAALNAKKRPLSDLTAIVESLDYHAFIQTGKVRKEIDKVTGRAGMAFHLIGHEGLYSGDYLTTWLSSRLAEIGVETFGDLAIDDPDLPPERRYSLVVTVSDITRRKSTRLPWDFHEYGLDPASQPLVGAVRASMSIPFFFEPVRIEAKAAAVDGTNWPAGTCTWVDGGMLDNFPVDVFDRGDGDPGRWPTIGIKLSGRTVQAPPTSDSAGTIHEGLACLQTLLDNADRFYVTPQDAERTIFVDHGDVATTDFDITPAQTAMLLANGTAAARAFVQQAVQQPAQQPAPAPTTVDVTTGATAPVG